MSLRYNADNSYLFVNGKEIYTFKVSNKNNNFPFRLCLGTMSNEFDYVDSEEIFFKGNVYEYVDKYNILNVNYLMIENSI